jgi:hypothetical protein
MVGKSASLMLDQDGNTHISFYGSTRGNPRYAAGSVAGEQVILLPIVVNE